MIRKRRSDPNQLELFNSFKKPSSPPPAPSPPARRTPPPEPVVAVRLEPPKREGLVFARQTDGYYRFQPKPDHPTSRWVIGPFNAIEAGRVMRGLSIELGGMISGDSPYCLWCMRFIFRGNRSTPLYLAEREDGCKLEGERFECALCGAGFTAQRDEFN